MNYDFLMGWFFKIMPTTSANTAQTAAAKTLQAFVCAGTVIRHWSLQKGCEREYIK